MTAERTDKCRAFSVYIVLLPPHLTNVVLPLDETIFRLHKKTSTKLEKKHQGQQRVLGIQHNQLQHHLCARNMQKLMQSVPCNHK